MISEYITRGVQVLTATLGLTKVSQNLNDPIVDAVNSNAAILDNAAIVVSAPATSSSAAKPGQIATDGTYLYIATGTNQWKRIALATF